MSIVCLIFNVTTQKYRNFETDTFFVPNSINSFKKWNPDVELIVITNDNMNEYTEPGYVIDEDSPLPDLRMHIVDYLFRHELYSKVILLGADTVTCSHVDELIECDDCDLLCTGGPMHWEVTSPHWKAEFMYYEYNGKVYRDILTINADVTCFNSAKAASTVYRIFKEFPSSQAEQGALYHCVLRQRELDMKVRIVDFPYEPSKVVYNIRSKGIAAGAFQMRRGKVYYGFDGPESPGVPYPTSEFVVDEDRLFTKDGKRIRIFHYAESLGAMKDTSDGVLLSRQEQIDEIKSMWFNSATKNFFKVHCNCDGFT
jgi:hypothetical protein